MGDSLLERKEFRNSSAVPVTQRGMIATSQEVYTDRMRFSRINWWWLQQAAD